VFPHHAPLHSTGTPGCTANYEYLLNRGVTNDIPDVCYEYSFTEVNSNVSIRLFSSFISEATKINSIKFKLQNFTLKKKVEGKHLFTFIYMAPK
jgi:hypothetical protein